MLKICPEMPLNFPLLLACLIGQTGFLRRDPLHDKEETSCERDGEIV